MLRSIAILTTSLLLTATAAVGRDTGAPDNSVEARAARFFDYREWVSAGALYAVLLDREPGNTSYYGRAIVAAGMSGDSLQQNRLTRQAFEAHVVVDSLFTAVERTSFSVGQTSLYEDYLLRTKVLEPWLGRIVDGYLMRYYSFRRNPEGMIAYSKIMLEGNPENELFLYTLAQGYLISGLTDDALNVYRNIVELNPRSVDAILYLANYYDLQAATDPSAATQALAYFLQASQILDTPYVAAAIRRLKQQNFGRQ